MITLTQAEVSSLVAAISVVRRKGDSELAKALKDIVDKAKENFQQQVTHQEGATKVLPPKQDYNYGCNAARYPYN